ncbi:MAG: cytosine permease [Candidatus Velthaea sp.]
MRSSATSEPYAASVAVVEPHGLEQIDERERHGKPRDLFALWFAANAETATFAVGILTIALYGTSFRGACVGLIIGNVLGYAVVAALSQLGPRFGRPQMVVSRRAFGRIGNELPAVLAFLSGVGWFAINSVFGAAALGALFHLSYVPSLAIVLAAQIAIAIYGHNMIHAFEKIAAVALTIGFVVIAVETLRRTNGAAGFDVHAPVAAGGEIAGVIFSAALAFSYAIGWAPCAADYSRYLPAASSARAVRSWAFFGGWLPSTALEILGAAAVTALPNAHLADATPSQVIADLFGGPLAVLGLVTVTLGTLSANCLNLYSGAMSALVAWDTRRRASLAIAVAVLFGALTALVLALARAGDPAAASLNTTTIVFAAAAVAALCGLVVRYTLARWQAALAVGIVGGALALVGAHPERTAHLYSNFLLLLSTWAAPWAGALLATRSDGTARPVAHGFAGWLAGIAASLPFWQQAWFTGPIAAANPRLGDVSYFVGFAVAFGVTRTLSHMRRAREAAA